MDFYNNVFRVDGFSRSLLVDIQKEKYLFIKKNELEEEIDMISSFCFNKSFNNIQSCFSKIDLKNHKAHYFNGIIDINETSIRLLDKYLEFISFINCNSLQIRFTEDIKIESIIKTLKGISKIDLIENFELLIPQNKYCIELMPILERIQVNEILIYNNLTPIDKKLIIPTKLIQYNPFKHNKIFFKFYFNQQFFIEAQKSNPYFFNKFFIDLDGKIHNAPENMFDGFTIHDINSFKKIKENLIQSIVEVNVPKSKIAICKDCEFKFSCIDNRIVKKKNNQYYYNQNCSYNPYINKWEWENAFIPVKNQNSEY